MLHPTLPPLSLIANCSSCLPVTRRRSVCLHLLRLGDQTRLSHQPATYLHRSVFLREAGHHGVLSNPT